MLVFIGTLHKGLTQKDELFRIIESFEPSQLLIEMCQQDIEANNTEDYPDEMRAALTWAINKHVKVGGFDSRIRSLKEDTSAEDIKCLDEEQMAIIRKYNWKDFNTPRLDKILRTKSWHKVIDEAKDNERELEMYKNIARLTDNSDNVVVITGSGHIPFFRRKFPVALFPLSGPQGSSPARSSNL